MSWIDQSPGERTVARPLLPPVSSVVVGAAITCVFDDRRRPWPTARRRRVR